MHVSKEGQWRSETGFVASGSALGFLKRNFLAAHISRPTLSHWETGRTLPDAQSLLVLSEIFGTSIDELVKGDVAEMEEMVDREARVAIGRTLALACVAVGAGVCLVAVSFTARYLVGSVAFYSMTLLGMVMGFTVIARAGEGRIRCIRRRVLAELAAGKCAAADKVVLRERLAHEIARDGVRDPYARLALGAACAVDIACMLVWFCDTYPAWFICMMSPCRCTRMPCA